MRNAVCNASGSRVLIACEPGCNGVFRHVEELTCNLVNKGVGVDLGYSSTRGSDRLGHLIGSVEKAGGEVLDLRVGNAPQLGDAPALAKLVSLVRHSKPNVIHCHSSKAGILGRATGVLTGVPTVYTPHAYYGMGKKAGTRTALFNSLERLFANFGHTINVSEDEAVFARECLGLKPDQQSVIPNAVDTNVFKPGSLEKKKQWRLAKGVPPDALVIGTLGRLSYQKDPLTLYRAFERIAKHQPRVYLAHLGTGELATECQEWVSKAGLSSKIVRIDYSPDPSDFYKVLDAFVLSSRYEGLSFAVLEALATDLPLILTDVPGNRDFIRFGLSHLWTAPAESPVALSEAILKCLQSFQNPSACNHREVARCHFSEEVCFGKILDLYKTLAANHRKRGFFS